MHHTQRFQQHVLSFFYYAVLADHPFLLPPTRDPAAGAPSCSCPFNRITPLCKQLAASFHVGSSVQYTLSSGIVSQLVVMSFRFLTKANDSAILSLNSRSSNSDFCVIFIAGGKLHFDFSIGNGIVSASSPRIVNDGELHTVVVQLSYNEAILFVDGHQDGSVASPGASTWFNALPGTKLTLGDSFQGVLRDVSVGGRTVLGLAYAGDSHIVAT